MLITPKIRMSGGHNTDDPVRKKQTQKPLMNVRVNTRDIHSVPVMSGPAFPGIPTSINKHTNSDSIMLVVVGAIIILMFLILTIN